ncbi:MAG: oligosaccharide flippase family protein [Dehalococcoidia bacterium]|nr:oligosaccharide flippase family protein [Dehalococcoidia bacterium]
MLDPDPSEGLPSQRLGSHETGRIFGTIGAVLSRQVVVWLATAITIGFVPRLLGAANFGSLSAIVAISTYVTVFAGAGLGPMLVRRAAVYPDSVTSDLRSALLVRYALALVTVPVVIVFAIANSLSGLVLALLGAVLFQTATNLATTALSSSLQGRHKLGYASITSAIAEVLTQALFVVALLQGYGLSALLVVMPLSGLVNLCVHVYFFRRVTPSSLRGSGIPPVAFWRAGLPFLAIELGNLIFGYVDILMLSWMTSAAVVGTYTFGWRLAGFVASPALIVAPALLPSLTLASVQDSAYFRQTMATTLRVIAALAIPMSVGAAVLAPALAPLIGGDEFEDAAIVMRLLLAVFPLVAMDVVLGTAVQAAGLQRAMSLTAWGAVVLNVAANFVAIPLAHQAWGNGGIGAALTTGVTELYMHGCLLYLLRRHLAPSAALRNGYRALAASAVMGGAVLVLSPLVPLAATIALGGGVYVVLAVALRVISREDYDAVVRAFRARRGAAAS